MSSWKNKPVNIYMNFHIQAQKTYTQEKVWEPFPTAPEALALLIDKGVFLC